MFFQEHTTQGKMELGDSSLIRNTNNETVEARSLFFQLDSIVSTHSMEVPQGSPEGQKAL